MSFTINNKPINIESPKYGVMEFSELILKDFSWLDGDRTQNLSAREFTVQLIHSHLLTPKLDAQEVRNWSDDELSIVAVQWVRNQQEESTLPDAASFEEIKDGIYKYHDSLTSEARKQLDALFKSQMQFINSMSKSFLPSVQLSPSVTNLGGTLTQVANSIVLPQVTSLQSTLASIANMSAFGKTLVELGSVFQQAFASTQMISNLYKSIAASLPQLNISPALLNTTKFFAGLPNLTELDKILKEAKEGGDAFNKAGVSFITSDYVSFSTVRHYASISPKIRSAVIINQLASETRKSEFEQQLQQLFQQSSVLRRRWPIVSQAIKAHRRREYNLSVPTLLAQVEGVVGDALILNGLIASQGHKLYLKEANGKLKLNRNRKPIEVHGVGTLIQRSSWQTHPALQSVADLITTQLAGERNHILHGRKTNYGTARLSVQGLLLLLVLAAEVTVFETGKTP